jgi:Uracil-DNA glycosylase
VPWDDVSGDTLRDWLGVDRMHFYDARIFALMPMGFCYPGRDRRGGDAPPRPECAPAWHASLLEHLPALRLRLAIGRYAQNRYLGATGRALADVIAEWQTHLARGWLALPHPSPRNRLWLRKHPWFENEVLPALRRAVASALSS